MDKRRQHSE